MKHIILALGLLIPSQVLSEPFFGNFRLTCDKIENVINFANENYTTLVFMGEDVNMQDQSVYYSLWINESNKQFITIGVNNSNDTACLFFGGGNYTWLYEGPK